MPKVQEFNFPTEGLKASPLKKTPSQDKPRFGHFNKNTLNSKASVSKDEKQVLVKL